MFFLHVINNIWFNNNIYAATSDHVYKKIVIKLILKETLEQFMVWNFSSILLNQTMRFSVTITEITKSPLFISPPRDDIHLFLLNLCTNRLTVTLKPIYFRLNKSWLSLLQKYYLLKKRINNSLILYIKSVVYNKQIVRFETIQNIMKFVMQVCTIFLFDTIPKTTNFSK